MTRASRSPDALTHLTHRTMWALAGHYNGSGIREVDDAQRKSASGASVRQARFACATRGQACHLHAHGGRLDGPPPTPP